MPNLKELAPAEYHEKPYLKDLLDKDLSEALPALLKKHDNAEALIGKKTIPSVPGADAKDEDWDKFLTQLRPGKADEYEIPGGEDKTVKRDEAFIAALRESFLEGNISKRQAAKFLSSFMPKLKAHGDNLTKAQRDAQAKADAEFESLVKASFGDAGKAKIDRARKLIAEHAPATVKPYVDKLDNNQLAILAGVINGVFEKYAGEEELNPQGGASGGDDGADLHKQILELRKSEAYTNAFHKDHDKVKGQVREMYKQLDKARNGGK